MKLAKFALTPPIAAISIAIFAAFAAFGEDGVLYVKPGGSDSASGADWENALATPQVAVDKLGAEGGTVYLGEGTFTGPQPILNLTTPVTVIGEGKGRTTLLPDNSAAQPTVINSCAGAVVRGVTITGNSKARALKFTGSAGIVEQCCIGTNKMGGVWFSGTTCSGLVSRCEIACNTGADKGGGVLFDNVRTAYAIVENSLIVGNTATGSGDSGGGGAVFNNGSDSQGTLRYCTIVNNYSPVGAVNNYYGMGSRCRFYNCVFYGNTCASTATTPDFRPGYYGMSSAYSIKNCYTAEGFGTAPVSGKLSFVDYVGGNFRLRYGSCCLDAAFMIGNEEKSLDLDGAPRLVGDVADIGCYESQETGFRCGIFVGAEEIASGGAAELQAVVSTEGDYTYVWTVADAAGVVVAMDSGASCSPEINASGYLTVRLEVKDSAGEETLATAVAKNALQVRPAVVYVVPEEVAGVGAGTYPYDTWAKATTDIRAAMEVVMTGGTVLLSNGTHKVDTQLKISRPITLQGFGGRDEVFLRKLTTDSTSSKAGDRILYLDHADVKIRDLTVVGARANCYKSADGNDNNGCGIYLVAGGTVENCRITDCSCANYNGTAVVYCKSAKGRITRCIIDDNDYSRGFTQAYGAKAVAVYISAGQIDNSLICNNVGPVGGGVQVASSGRAINCTIVGNKNTTESSGGLKIGVLTSGKGLVQNCIAAGNTADASKSASKGYPEWLTTATSAADLKTVSNSVVNCCFGKDYAWPLGVGCIDAAPGFNGEGDYTLNANSELIDKGADYDTMLDDTDLAGLPRLSGKAVDVGAYEYDQSKRTVDFSLSSSQTLSGNPLTLTGKVMGGNEGIDYTYVWTVTREDQSADPVVGGGQTLVLGTLLPGRYSVTLSVTETESGESVGSKTVSSAVTVGAKMLYVVSAEGYEGEGGEWPYDSWDKATTNVFDALKAALSGATVCLSNGLHMVGGTVNLTNAVTLAGFGGWQATTLKYASSGPAERLLYINNANAVVEGLTLMGGKLNAVWSRGFSICIDTKGGMMRDCRITGTNNGYMGVQGVIAVNYSTSVGGTGGVIDRCIIDNNKYTATPYLSSGGAVYLAGGILRNSLIYGNSGCQAGGVDICGPAAVQSCTIVSNVVRYAKGSGESNGGGGIDFRTSAEGARVENCIVAFNCYGSVSNDFLICGSAAVTNAAVSAVRSCLFTDETVLGADQIFGAPRFKKVAATAVDGDWRLKRSSPGCKTGFFDATWMPTATDLGGEPRCFLEGKVDIGCYEAPWFLGGFLLLVR